MADTPTDGTSDTTPTKPAPRRRTRATVASSAIVAAPVKKRRGPAKKPATAAAEMVKEAKTAATEVVTTVKPKVKRAVRKVKAAPAAAVKPANRRRVAVGLFAAAVGVAAGVVATVGRKKIAAVSGDVMDVVAGHKPESQTLDMAGVPDKSPVPPVN